jgi:hypothetical protein
MVFCFSMNSLLLAYMHGDAHACDMHTHGQMRAPPTPLAHAHAHRRAGAHTQTHTSTHARTRGMHARTRSHAHTHTHTHAHAVTHTHPPQTHCKHILTPPPTCAHNQSVCPQSLYLFSQSAGHRRSAAPRHLYCPGQLRQCCVGDSRCAVNDSRCTDRDSSSTILECCRQCNTSTPSHSAAREHQTALSGMASESFI